MYVRLSKCQRPICQGGGNILLQRVHGQRASPLPARREGAGNADSWRGMGNIDVEAQPAAMSTAFMAITASTQVQHTPLLLCREVDGDADSEGEVEGMGNIDVEAPPATLEVPGA